MLQVDQFTRYLECANGYKFETRWGHIYGKSWFCSQQMSSYDSLKFIWCEKVLLQSIDLLMQCHGLHHAMVILFEEHSLLRCQNHILIDGKVVIFFKLCSHPCRFLHLEMDESKTFSLVVLPTICNMKL